VNPKIKRYGNKNRCDNALQQTASPPRSIASGAHDRSPTERQLKLHNLTTRFSYSLLQGIWIAFVFVVPLSIAGQDADGKQRELIGESLGKPVYRDEIRTTEGAALASELHRLFTAAAIEEYAQQHKDEITPTPVEIAAGTQYFIKKHRERLKEQDPALQGQLKAIDEKYAAVDLQEAEKSNYFNEKRAIQWMMTPPGESFAKFALNNLKFQRHLYLKYGGGRILFQQAGLESFDASRKWLESLEEAGKFKVTDAKLRSVLYHYYTTQDHGPFLSKNEEYIREITEPEWLEKPTPKN
jgi:hypothetical protein